MESQEKQSFEIVNNNFQNACSDFFVHTSLKTTAGLAHPYYAKLSVTRNTTDTKILAIRTSQSIMQVVYKGGEYQGSKKITPDDERLEKQVVVTFVFKPEVFNPTSPFHLVFGYRSGLISYYDCKKEKILGLYNVDEKEKAIQKNCPVSQIVVLPKPNDDEIIVMFEDSTAIKYRLNTQAQNPLFAEKIKKFEAKTSFNKALNQFKQKTKTKNTFFYSCYLNDLKPEFNHFYATNRDSQAQNPLAYYKFNHRTISDFTIKKHHSFTKTLWKDTNDPELTVLALGSLDGFLVLFDLNVMRPLISYKGYFGGVNSITFSENCELIALSGQDDYITVLDLKTLTTLKCEGHKSFVSRAIFQSISPIKTIGKSKEENINEQKGMKSTKNLDFLAKKNESTFVHDYVRVIGGGMDAILSFWEFRKDIFGSKKWLQTDESQFPIRLQQGNMPKPHIIPPVHMEKVQDAIGWVDICDDMLIYCGYDGGISTYIIKDLIPQQSSKEDLSSTDNEKDDKKSSQEKKAQDNHDKEALNGSPSFKKKESNSDFKNEQKEYENEASTVSQTMENFENRNVKSPSRSFISMKQNENDKNKEQ